MLSANRNQGCLSACGAPRAPIPENRCYQEVEFEIPQRDFWQIQNFSVRLPVSLGPKSYAMIPKKQIAGLPTGGKFGFLFRALHWSID